jgi:hypothetical protein
LMGRFPINVLLGALLLATGPGLAQFRCNTVMVPTQALIPVRSSNLVGREDSNAQFRK